LPRLAKCQAAPHIQTLEIRSTSDAADIGTEVAFLNAEYRRHGTIGQPSNDEVGFLAASCRKAWDEFKHLFTEPHIEEGMSGTVTGVQLTGTPDAWSPGVVWDDKTGRIEADCLWQLMGYAWLASIAAKDHPLAEWTLVAVDARTGSYRTWKKSEIDIYNELRNLFIKIVDWQDKYSTGDHCYFCPVAHACPAQMALVKSTAATLLPDVIQTVNALPPAKCVDLYRQMNMLEKRISEAKAALKLRVTTTGALAADDGMELAIVEESRDEIDALKAWPVLTAYLKEAELAGCVKILKGALMSAVADKAERGQKKAAKENLMVEIEAIGAVETSKIEKMVLRKKEGAK
jgi:hypothetical protein